MEVIPAIDLLGTRAVRLEQGDYDRATQYGEPAGARAQVRGGGRDADPRRRPRRRARRPEPARSSSAALVAAAAPVPRAGVRRRALASRTPRRSSRPAPSRVVVGTAAWTLLDELVAALGERLVVALDVRDGVVRRHGWTEGSLDVDEAIDRCVAARVPRLLCTAIERDGTLAGPDVELVRRVVGASGLPGPRRRRHPLRGRPRRARGAPARRARSSAAPSSKGGCASARRAVNGGYSSRMSDEVPPAAPGNRARGHSCTPRAFGRRLPSDVRDRSARHRRRAGSPARSRERAGRRHGGDEGRSQALRRRRYDRRRLRNRDCDAARRKRELHVGLAEAVPAQARPALGRRAASTPCQILHLELDELDLTLPACTSGCGRRTTTRARRSCSRLKAIRENGVSASSSATRGNERRRCEEGASAKMKAGPPRSSSRGAPRTGRSCRRSRRSYEPSIEATSSYGARRAADECQVLHLILGPLFVS